MEHREEKLIAYLRDTGEQSSKQIFEGLPFEGSFATLKRQLNKLVANHHLEMLAQGRATKYRISLAYEVVQDIDLDTYFRKEIDERKIREKFNFSLLRVILPKIKLFTKLEMDRLITNQALFKRNISELLEKEYQREFERLAIDLSWKSSQIEGNTYSLLETERLLKEKETASGKTKDEAVMLLNHKDAIDFLLGQADYVRPLSVSKIEDIHGMLMKDLEVDRNIRKRRVGISGTNYTPLELDFQIIEALELTCILVNNRESVFEKALLALVLLSYIQPFMDGNKRTARIVSNAILMGEDHCPLSYRTVDSIHYKKAMLLFYEQNNLSKVKEIFMDQFEFAVQTYF